MQKAYPVFDGAEPAVGSQLKGFLNWPGGRGWLQVSGTFVGSSAVVSLNAIANMGVLGAASVSPLPDLPTGISAAGVYPFEAPEGTMVFSSPAIAVGDILVLTLNAIEVS